MAAEIFALSYGFDNAYVTQSMLREILRSNVPIEAYVDSKTLFGVVAKYANTKEKRLQIDVAALREAHSKREIRSLSWIPGTSNPADGLTKGIVNDSHPLLSLLNNNELSITEKGWSHNLSFRKKNLECRHVA